MSTGRVQPGLVTPEAVVLDLGVAGLATRSLAKFIDLICQALVALLLVLLAALVGGSLGSIVVGRILIALGLFLVIVGLPALSETLWNGRTPGKAMLGLRVVTDEGGPTSFRHAILRGLLLVVELSSGLGLLVALSNPLNKRLGDIAAGTQVIVDRPWEAPLIPTVFFPPAGFERYVEVLDVAKLASEDFLLIRTFLMRVSELDAVARGHLAVRLANGFRQRCEPAPPASLHPELYLICLASAFQVRHGGLPDRTPHVSGGPLDHRFAGPPTANPYIVGSLPPYAGGR